MLPDTISAYVAGALNQSQNVIPSLLHFDALEPLYLALKFE